MVSSVKRRKHREGRVGRWQSHWDRLYLSPVDHNVDCLAESKIRSELREGSWVGMEM